MHREEYRHLPRYAPSTKAELAIRLMGDCGLRVAETLSVSYDDTDRSQDGKHYFLAVTEGKDTTGEFEGGKYRETWLTPDLERDLYRYYDERGLDQSEPLIDREKRTVQWWVEQAAERAAEETGDDDYRKVSTHDLRRCWANYLLVEESTSPRIVMALGGWNSYDAIEPYLAAPTESIGDVCCLWVQLLHAPCSRHRSTGSVNPGTRRERPRLVHPRRARTLLPVVTVRGQRSSSPGWRLRNTATTAPRHCTGAA